MNLDLYYLFVFIFLPLSPVRHLAESLMGIHMHMQMPLLAIAGMLMAPFLQKKFGSFFAKWNANGVPGIILRLIVVFYWLIPRTMDDALMQTSVEIRSEERRVGKE